MVNVTGIADKSAEEVLDMFETQGLLVIKTNYPFAHLPGGAQQITSEAHSIGIIEKQKKDKDFVCTTFVQNGLNVPLFTRTPLGMIMDPDNISQTLLIGKIDILSHDNDKESKLDEVEQTIKYDQITGAKLDDPWIKKDDKGLVKKKKVSSNIKGEFPVYDSLQQLSEAIAYDQFREKKGLFSRQDGRAIKQQEIHSEINVKTNNPHTVAGFFVDEDIDKMLLDFNLVSKKDLNSYHLLRFLYTVCNAKAPLFKYHKSGKMEKYDRTKLLNDIIYEQFTKKPGIPQELVTEQIDALSKEKKSSKECMDYLLEKRTNTTENIKHFKKKIRFQSLFETLTRFQEDIKNNPIKESSKKDRNVRQGVDQLIDNISLDTTKNIINKQQFVAELREMQNKN